MTAMRHGKHTRDTLKRRTRSLHCGRRENASRRWRRRRQRPKRVVVRASPTNIPAPPPSPIG